MAFDTVRLFLLMLAWHRKLYLINSKNLNIGVGIGKMFVINSEELQIGIVFETDI